MLYAVVKVSSRILSPTGKMPIREYEHPPAGCTKFLFSMQYRTPSSRANSDNSDSTSGAGEYDYE